MQSKVKDILFKLTTVVICGFAYCMCNRTGNSSAQPRSCYEPREDWYGLAAKAISKSSMCSSDRTQALQNLLIDGPDRYYRSVIHIVNSSMCSSDRLLSLERESAKFANPMRI